MSVPCERDFIKTTFPADDKNAALARGLVGLFLARANPTMEELSDIKTAVSEAVTNCIVHAYPDESGNVDLSCEFLDEHTISVTVRDTGVGIPDVEAARTPMFTTGGEERSGLGFTIMEQFMSELRVTSGPGKGTEVVMIRKLGGEDAL